MEDRARIYSYLSRDYNAIWRHLEDQHELKTGFLMPTLNRHNTTTDALYNTSPIPKEEIQLEEIKSRMPFDRLHLFHPKGPCRGQTTWFLYLFLKTVGQFKDPIVCAKTVGSLFCKGAPEVASFLQGLVEEEELLDLKFTMKLSFNKEALENQRTTSSAYVEQLPPGIYGIGLHRHRIAYISLDASLWGIKIDFNHGVTLIRKAKLLDDLWEKYQHKADPSEGHSSYLYFDQVTWKNESTSQEQKAV